MTNGMIGNINKKKAIGSLTLNSIIFVMMIIGLIVIVLVEKANWTVLKYFTLESNILMGIVSLIYVILLSLVMTKKLKSIPKALEMIKLMTTTGVVLTFLAVILFLIPVAAKEGQNPGLLLWNSSLFFHALIPILSAVTWFIFEHSEHKYKYGDSWFSMIHIVLYGIFYIVMAFTHRTAEGGFQPGYDWYTFIKTFGVKWSPVVCLVMLGVSYLIGWCLWFGSKKINLFPNYNKN